MSAWALRGGADVVTRRRLKDVYGAVRRIDIAFETLELLLNRFEEKRLSTV
jgi:hypothetical protein